ncbi:MAG TPA: ABC transporter ATP-binding protein [Chloroflexi bacterium]|jgi:ATP-binding cassette subfamily B multidrug efflux pump|nr:ABC transporter ATP-binding protein [Chloroflexota bacterium]
MRSILRVLSYMRSFWLGETTAYLCMLGINAMRLITPQIIRRIIDVGIGENQPDVLITSVLLLVVATLVQGIFRFGQGYLAEWVSQNIAYIMRGEIYRKLQSLSFSYHDRSQAGQLLSRATSDVERLQRITGQGILGMVDAMVLLIGTTAILLNMQPMLAVLSLLVMPVVLFLMRRYMKRMRPRFHERQDRIAIMTSRLEQNLLGMSVVRGFAQEPAEISRFGAENDRIFDTSQSIARESALTMPLIIFLASASTVLILWIGGQLVIQGRLTLGELVAFNSYLLQLVNPIRRMGFLATLLGESRASAERVFEILDADSEVKDRPGAIELENVRGDVTFDRVTFAYIPGSNPVLQDVSFEVKAGQVVALLGPTGSGKSTITNLIPRFYDVTAGRVLVDGHDVRDVTLKSLRSHIGMVLQETTLFGSTIRENISFGRNDATQAEIEEAAKAAAIHDFIASLPAGYSTAVGERGVTLSGGQRQRIAIARALLLNPSILILDDATSSVDTETEKQIQGALERLMEGRTSFIIAQRVSTVRSADQIFVIDEGRLVAQGKHEDLIRESGIYAEIYHRQLKTDNDLPEASLARRDA